MAAAGIRTSCRRYEIGAEHDDNASMTIAAAADNGQK
jgi:hypothetical protein